MLFNVIEKSVNVNVHVTVHVNDILFNSLLGLEMLNMQRVTRNSQHGYPGSTR